MSLNFYVRVRSASNLLQRCQHQLKACAYMLQLKGQTQRNFGLSQHSWIPNKSKSFSLRITPATKPNGSSESTRKVSGGSDSVLKLYVTRDSPPSVAVEACLKYLKLEYETVGINLERGEQFSLHFLQKNPNGEVPCLDDNEFFVSESAAILQYLADKYKKNETFYPWNPQQRARINQLLAFNNTTLYRAIMDYWGYTTFFAYPKLELNLKKMNHAVKVFNNLLAQNTTPYVAGTDKVTIADVHLLMSQICLDGIEFKLADYPHITKWYQFIQKNEDDIWSVGQKLRDSIREFVRNPPEEPPIPKSHPVHPCKSEEFR